MSSIQIWDRESSLNGIEKDVWLESYPRSKKDTLVLVDGGEVVFLEDLKGIFSGSTDEEIVKSYLEKREKDREESEKKLKEKEDSQPNSEPGKEENKSIEKLIKEESDKVRLEYATAIAELVENLEKDKLELSTAIVEAIEMKSGGR